MWAHGDHLRKDPGDHQHLLYLSFQVHLLTQTAEAGAKVMPEQGVGAAEAAEVAVEV